MRWVLVAVWAGLAVGCGSSRSSDGDGEETDPDTALAFGECAGFTACGGNLVGRWRYGWSCEESNSQSPFSDPACAGSTYTESTATDVTFDFRSDGTVTFAGSASSTVDLTVTDACSLALFSMDAAWYCNFNGSAGTDPNRQCHAENGLCACHIVSTSSVEQVFTYAVMGNVFQVRDSNGFESPAQYCVDDGRLTYRFDSGPDYSVFERE